MAERREQRTLSSDPVSAHLRWLEVRLALLDDARRVEFARDCVSRSMAEVGRADRDARADAVCDLLAHAMETLVLADDFEVPELDDRGDLASCRLYLMQSVWYQITNFIRYRAEGESRAAFWVAQTNLELIQFLLARYGVQTSGSVDPLLQAEIDRQVSFVKGEASGSIRGLFGGRWFPRHREDEVDKLAEAILARWRAESRCREPADPARLDLWPAGLRTMYLRSDGMTAPDSHYLQFLPASDCRWMPVGDRRALVFADYLVGSHEFGVVASPVEDVVVAFFSPDHHVLLGSFQRFLKTYLDDPDLLEIAVSLDWVKQA